MKQQTKYCIYTRVSTAMQVDGYSLDAQKDKLRKYAEYQEMTIANDGINGVAAYLNRNGFVKKTRQNNTIPGFSSHFIKLALDNPIYMGKIAFGRHKTEKRLGSRNEMHVVKQSEFPIYEGQHEAIISEEDWNLAQAKRHLNGYRRKRIRTIRQEQLTGENIYRLLLAFEQLYNTCSEAEQRDLMRALIDRIDLYPEKPNDGCWIRKIVFNFPIPINGEEAKEFPLENQTMLETVCCLYSQQKDFISRPYETKKADDLKQSK